MNSRTLVMKTLEFDRPARIPRQMWVLPWAQIHYRQQLAEIKERFPDDILGSPGFAQALKTQGDAYKKGIFVDEWGCVFENRHDGIIGELREPIIKSWQDMEKIKEPQEALTVEVAKVNQFCRSTDKFVMANCCPRPFERLQFLRGTENVMLDLAAVQPELFVLLDRIHRFFVKEFELWSSTDVDGLMFMDDWGSQKSLLISPSMWREIFRPLYEEYISIAHAANKKVFMHTDGNVLEIMPDFVEIGIDAINCQVFCMAPEQLGSFAGKITFWGELDRQWLLPCGGREDVKKAVADFNRSLYHNGGVIAQLEFGAGAKPENVRTAFEAWENFEGISDQV